MPEDREFQQIRKAISDIEKELAVARQRLDSYESRIERSYIMIGEVRAENRTEIEGFRRSTERLFEIVNKINGGINTLKWAIPVWISVAAIFVGIIVAATQAPVG